MRDEAASYSSRPGSEENSVGDGYAFTIDAHRRYGIPQMWAMNGGLATLLAHDCPDDVAAMRRDVEAGLLVPVVAGYGAHRLPYYTAGTNVDAIRFGARVLEKVLGAARPVYYPDQRLTTCKDNVAGALRSAGMEYVVVDAGTGQGAVPEGAEEAGGNTAIAHAKPPMGALHDGRWMNWQYVWRDRRSGTKVLFIDKEMKDGLFAADGDTADRGKPAQAIRCKLLELASAPVVHAGNLVVYSDDADKASGNGWFDGGYDTRAANNFRYQAVLSWLATHPWVEVVTTDDLTDADVVGELDLLRASDPYIEEQWRLPNPPARRPRQRAGLRHLVRRLGRHPRRLARRDAARRLGPRRAGASTARAGRRPGRRGRAAAARPPVLPHVPARVAVVEAAADRARPRRFRPLRELRRAESLQLRNAHVYLAARHWARWARDGGTGAHRDDGPVVAAVAEAGVPGPTPPWWRPEQAGLQWDHDPLTNVVLYNEHALVVVDRNGGRITQLFALVGDRPVAVSGTFKAYQFVDSDWASDSGVECDGLVLQNTVWSPNHGYVACDVEASRRHAGLAAAERPRPRPVLPGQLQPVRRGARRPRSVGDVRVRAGDRRDAARDRRRPRRRCSQHDRDEKLAGRRGTVLHDVDEFGAFRKTVRLDGRTVHVAYQDVEPGHRVANEFCVDLLAAALHGHRQTHAVAADGRSATVTNTDGLAVRIELGPGCRFSDAVATPMDVPTADSLRLHRVLTDDLEIIAPDGGDFDYRIVLP